MKKYEKEILINQLSNEEKELKHLKGIYNKALQDINDNLATLLGRNDASMQHVIYQVDYQKALKKQISGILDELNAKQFKSISDYMAQCYENGFLGAMYSIHKQGVPIIMPINQKKVVEALKTDSKISEGLYKKLSVDTELLKKRIANNLSRGISSNMTYSNIAKNIASDGKVGYNNAARIARTEGGRIDNKSRYDAMVEAKANGADVLKSWNSTLDGKTRPEHRKLDGEIRELEEKFSNGLMYPCDRAGKAADVINCRCVVMQETRWALDEDELQTLKDRAAYFGLDKTKDFEDFKKKYLKAVANSAKSSKINKELSQAAKDLIDELETNKVEFREVQKLSKTLSTDEIIEKLGGGDMTAGSCSSLAFCYAGNKNGLDVVDFRGGNSQHSFSLNKNIQTIIELPGVNGTVTKVKKEIQGTMEVLKTLELNKEYYLGTGKHAAIVRRLETGYEYLELQSSIQNGWMPFDGGRYGTMADTLSKRFGCRKTVDKSYGVVWERSVFLAEVDSFADNTDFERLLGYINTAADKQKKGASGSVK